MRFGFVPMLHTASGRAFMLPYGAVPFAVSRKIDGSEAAGDFGSENFCPVHGHAHGHGVSVTEVPLTGPLGEALMSALGAFLAEAEAHGRPEPQTAAPGARRPAD